MAITNYSELKTAIASWLNRDDLTSQIPDFITLAESNINRDVRHWRMETRSTLSISSQFTTLPTDWLQSLRISLQGDGTSELEVVNLAEMAHMRSANSDATGRPQYYAISGNEIEVYPSPDGTYTADVIYVTRTTALSDANTTNWLLTYAPDVYLYATLIQAAPYLMEDDRTGVWASMYAAGVKNLNKDSKRAKVSGSGLRLKVKSY